MYRESAAFGCQDRKERKIYNKNTTTFTEDHGPNVKVLCLCTLGTSYSSIHQCHPLSPCLIGTDYCVGTLPCGTSSSLPNSASLVLSGLELGSLMQDKGDSRLPDFSAWVPGLPPNYASRPVSRWAHEQAQHCGSSLNGRQVAHKTFMFFSFVPIEPSSTPSRWY